MSDSVSLKNILVATDLSEPAKIAVDQALAIARRYQAETTLLYVGNFPPFEEEDVPPQLGSVSTDYTNVRKAILDDAKTRMRMLREELQEPGLTISQLVVDGYPDDKIAAVADEMGAELTVVGTHGRTGLKRLLIGSAAERTVRRCKGKVLVARSAEASRYQRGYQRVLVPVDFSDYMAPVLEAALTLCADDGTLELFHAWQLPNAVYSANDAAIDFSLLASFRAELAGDTKRRLEEAADELSGRFSGEIVVAQEEANPKVAIQNRLGRGDYDLVAMGSHGRRGVGRWLLGSVAETTVRHAPCSVLVVHKPE